MEQITFSNVEAQVVGYLAPLAGVPAYRVIPAARPTSFVRVLLTGTRRLGLTQADASVTLECWAASDAAAHDLARKVYGLMCAMDLADGSHVPDGEDGWAGGPYPSPDPDSGTPRYVMTAVVRQPAILLEA